MHVDPPAASTHQLVMVYEVNDIGVPDHRQRRQRLE